jgi:predicted DNA-binding antitoxin AbrB/MazE fold protein
MTFQIDAIYDGGVLKPLQPLALPDRSRVTLTVAEIASSSAASSSELAEQQAALDELRRAVDAIPQTRNNDGWSARDHDKLLYDELQ